MCGGGRAIDGVGPARPRSNVDVASSSAQLIRSCVYVGADTSRSQPGWYLPVLTVDNVLRIDSARVPEMQASLSWSPLVYLVINTPTHIRTQYDGCKEEEIWEAPKWAVATLSNYKGVRKMGSHAKLHLRIYSAVTLSLRYQLVISWPTV